MRRFIDWRSFLVGAGMVVLVAAGPKPISQEVGAVDRPGISQVTLWDNGTWRANLPDGTVVEWRDDAQGHRWVRYDFPDLKVLTGRVDARGRRFGPWHVRGGETTLWAWGREVDDAEFDRIMREDPPPMVPKK